MKSQRAGAPQQVSLLRLLVVGMLPGIGLLLLAALAPLAQATSRDGDTCGRAWQAAWHPEDLRFTGERIGDAAQAEVVVLRGECHDDGVRTIDRAKERAADGGLALALGIAAAAAVHLSRRKPSRTDG